MSRSFRLMIILAGAAFLCPSDAALAADSEGSTVAAAKAWGADIDGRIDTAGDVDWWYFQSGGNGNSNSYWSGGLLDKGGVKVQVYKSRQPGVKPASQTELIRVKTMVLTRAGNNLGFLTKAQHYYFLKVQAAVAGKIGRYTT